MGNNKPNIITKNMILIAVWMVVDAWWLKIGIIYMVRR